MPEFFSPLLELSAIIPGAMLCFIPLRLRMRYSAGRTFSVLAPLLLAFCFAGALLCSSLKIRTEPVLYPALPFFIFLYYRLTKQPLWRAASIVLGICCVFSSLGMLSIAVDSLYTPVNIQPWIGIKAGLIYNLICWMFVLICWYPASRKVPWLFEGSYLAQLWYVFIIIPSVLIILNLFLIPLDYRNIPAGRPLAAFVSIELVIIGVLLLSYLLFYYLARRISHIVELQRENQFLQMQAAQYETLRSAISETQQARHDLRHHINALSALADKADWDTLKSYLKQVREAVPRSELKLCDNSTVDSILGYYAAMCRRDGIGFNCCAPLPQTLPVGEMELSIVLSNLLENAVEASYYVEPEKRSVNVLLELHGERIVLVMIDNYCLTAPQEKNGVFQSSKRAGDGVGLQSVRRIAGKNGGHCQFTYSGNVFHANVMLRGEN